MKTRRRYSKTCGLPSVRMVSYGGAGLVFLLMLICIGEVQAQSSQTEFKETTRMLKRRQMHGSAVLGNYLYVFGGVLGNDLYTNAVHKAPILENRQLGAWSETTPLPAPRAYIANSTLALNDMIYIIGGIDGTTDRKFNTVLWSRPLADGNLGPWTESPPFSTEGISNLTAVSTPGFIHILGGYTQDKRPLDAVLSGNLDAEGRLVSWEKGPPLPIPLWFHNAMAVAGRVYVWGGRSDKAMPPFNSIISARVFSSPILSTGRLGAWREESSHIPLPIHSAAGAVAGPFLMSFCPRDHTNTARNDVIFSCVTPQGLSAWQRIETTLPVRFYVAAAPDYRRGTIYIPGGRIDQQERDESVDDRVFFFELAPQLRSAAEQQLAYVQAGSTQESMTVETQPTPGGVASATPATGAGGAQFTYQVQSQAAKGSVQGFLPYSQARMALDRQPGKPLVLYFNLDGARPCIKQAEILQTSEFSPLTQQAVFAWIENREWPQLAQQLGIYRSPAWVIYNSRGGECGRHLGVLTPEQLAQGIQSCR